MQSMTPDIQGCVLCEDVRQEINGMQTLVGVLNVVPAPQLPITFLKLCIWTRWSGGSGRFEQRTRILTPDEDRVVGEALIHFELKEIEHHATNVHAFGGLKIENFGVHHVEVLLDGALRLRFPFSVMRIGAQG